MRYLGELNLGVEPFCHELAPEAVAMMRAKAPEFPPGCAAQLVEVAAATTVGKSRDRKLVAAAGLVGLLVGAVGGRYLGRR